MDSSGKHADYQRPGILRRFGSLLATVVFVFVIVWFVSTFVYRAYEIPSGSMEDTIEIGDMVFAEKVSYYFREPQVGDIVTFEDPLVPGRILIKRCIATEGQVVELVNGSVVVDGVALDEPYTDGKPSEPLRSTVTYPYTVPDGCIWVMGDNRTSSQDSRYFGAVPVSSVTGHAVFTYWPLDRIGVLE